MAGTIVAILTIVVGCAAYGSGVSLTEFRSTNLTKYEQSPGIDRYQRIHDVKIVAVNRTLFHLSEIWEESDREFLLSIGHPTDATWTHKRVNRPYDPYEERGKLFVLNNRVYTLVYKLLNRTSLMTGLALWENDAWRRLDGNFPHLLNQDPPSVGKLYVNPTTGNPNVAAIAVDCGGLGMVTRFDFHRLTLNGSRATIERVAGLHGSDYDVLSFFSLWKETLVAIVMRRPLSLNKLVIQLSQTPMPPKANSSDFTDRRMYDFRSGQRCQIGDYVVSSGGERLSVNYTSPNDYRPFASILDLNTMNVTETNVNTFRDQPLIADVEEKLIYQRDPDGRYAVASLIL